MIPEEDRPPSWLRGYGGIDADIRQLREFADKLQTEVERNYATATSRGQAPALHNPTAPKTTPGQEPVVLP